MLANNFTLVKAALAANPSPNIDYVYPIGHQYQWQTVLMVSAASGLQLPTMLLLEAGANIELTDNYGRTALQIAAGYNNMDQVVYLLGAGANLAHTDSFNQTARQWVGSRDFGGTPGMDTDTYKILDYMTTIFAAAQTGVILGLVDALSNLENF